VTPLSHATAPFPELPENATTPLKTGVPKLSQGERSDSCGLLWFLFEKNRIKGGENAVFPQEA
jgi:hypothetical protein